MKIPTFDLRPAADEIAEPLMVRWRRLLNRTAFVGGDEVKSFEAAFGQYVEAAGCVGVANGTDALMVALRALDLRPGDEVIVPAFTFIATAEAVVLAGGVPVFADVEPNTLNLDVADAARRCSERTRGVIAVHLYGMPCDVDAVLALCEDRGLWLVEDAAQAQGARYRGRPVGGFGALAGWSFYPSKNLGCFGDGGAVTGNDPILLERVRLIADHGRVAHYEHGIVGTNSRLDALQAAVLNLRLPLLARDNELRRAWAERYRRNLSDVGPVEFLEVPDGYEPVYHQLTIRASRRDDLRRALSDREIGSGVHYPIPLHRQPALAAYAREPCRVAEAAAADVLCLPMFPQLTPDQVDEVCAAVRAFYRAA